MNKNDYLKLAFKNNLFALRAWVFSAFTLQQESPDQWKKNPYKYRIVQTPTGVYFVNATGVDAELEPIEGCIPGQAPFALLDPIELKAREFENVQEDMVVSIGNLFFNLCSIIPAFGKKVDFIQGSVDISKVEAMIATRLKSTPLKPEDKNDTDLYVDEYIRFCDSFSYLTEFTQICTIALTPKAITQAPGTIELRDKLMKEYEGKTDDPVVVAKIEAELLKHDAEYLKGDPSENFLITKKSRATARKKLFLDYGADPGLTKTFKVDMIAKSLSEGWDVSKMPTMINALRAGSYDRGAETQLGGEAVKWLYRASSNINIKDEDCGSRIGLAVSVTEDNLQKLIGMRVITQNSTKLVEDKEQAGAYLGKRIMVRSPMYCKLDKTDYCRFCVGERLGTNPNSAATAISKLGSIFMALSLSSFHARSVTLVSMPINDFLS